MLKGNFYFSYTYIPVIFLHYLFLAMDCLLDGINKSRAVIVYREPGVKNFRWRIALLLICSSSLFSARKSQQREVPLHLPNKTSPVLPPRRNASWEVLLQGLGSHDNRFLLSVIQCSLHVPVLMRAFNYCYGSMFSLRLELPEAHSDLSIS